MDAGRTAAEFDVAVPPGAALGEGPRWDASTGTLLWVDIVGGAVHRYDPATGADTARRLPGLVSLALPRASGGVIAGLGDDVVALDGEHRATLVSLTSEGAATRTNDGACDARGRLWVGTMALDEESPAGALYRVDADLTVTAAVRGATIANGLGWSPAGDVFYFIDSPTSRVDAFAFDLESGAVEDRRPLAALDVDGAVPDGLAVDAEGCIWVALHGGWGLHRYAPDGELLAELRLPVARVTSCGFGGADLCDLYVTTRRDGLGAADLAEQPLAGALLRLDVGVTGLPTYAFAG
jgi:sugar lactone lactonase YvrE